MIGGMRYFLFSIYPLSEGGKAAKTVSFLAIKIWDHREKAKGLEE
jgi:hypothetical protein